MLYVQLDTNWPDNPKIIRAGWEAAGVHSAIMCLAKRLERDGWVDRALLARMGVSDAVLAVLAAEELIEVNGTQVRPWDWLERNPSQAAIVARRAAKAEGGRRGNHTKWEHPGTYESCPKCQVIAPCETDRSVSDRIPTSRVEGEVGTASPPATHVLPPEVAQANVTNIRALRHTLHPTLGASNA